MARSCGRSPSAGVGGVVPCIDTFEMDGAGRRMVMPRFPAPPRRLAQPGRGPARVARRCAQALRYCSVGGLHPRPGAPDARGRAAPWSTGTSSPENIFLDGQGRPPPRPTLAERWPSADWSASSSVCSAHPCGLPWTRSCRDRRSPNPTWDNLRAVCLPLRGASPAPGRPTSPIPRTLLTPAGREPVGGGPQGGRGTRGRAPGQWARSTSRACAPGAKAGRTSSTSPVMGPWSPRTSAAIDRGIHRLGSDGRTVGPTRSCAPMARQIWSLLNRGLSPVSHPSPPNRFRDGDRARRAARRDPRRHPAPGEPYPRADQPRGLHPAAASATRGHRAADVRRAPGADHAVCGAVHRCRGPGAAHRGRPGCRRRRRLALAGPAARGRGGRGHRSQARPHPGHRRRSELRDRPGRGHRGRVEGLRGRRGLQRRAPRRPARRRAGDRDVPARRPHLLRLGRRPGPLGAGVAGRRRTGGHALGRCAGNVRSRERAGVRRHGAARGTRTGGAHARRGPRFWPATRGSGRPTTTAVCCSAAAPGPRCPRSGSTAASPRPRATPRNCPAPAACTRQRNKGPPWPCRTWCAMSSSTPTSV